jgi:hypothetical protein
MTVQAAPIHDRLEAIEARFDELERLMGLPETATQPAKLAEYGRERAEIEEVVEAYRRLKGRRRSPRPRRWPATRPATANWPSWPRLNWRSCARRARRRWRRSARCWCRKTRTTRRM